jgi:hypothetical protein
VPVVDIPDRGDASHEMWLELIRLSKEQPAPWTLIGAHMVALHGWMRGRTPIRPSKDADILVDVRMVSEGTAAISQALIRDGYNLSERSVGDTAIRSVGARSVSMSLRRTDWEPELS